MTAHSTTWRRPAAALSFAILCWWLPASAEAGPEMSIGPDESEIRCLPLANVGGALLSGLAYAPNYLLLVGSDSRTAVSGSIGGGLGQRTDNLTVYLQGGPDELTQTEARRRRRQRRGTLGAARFGAEVRRTIAPEISLDFAGRWNNLTTWSSCSRLQTYSAVEEVFEFSLARPGTSELFLETGPEFALYTTVPGSDHERTFLLGPGLLLGSGFRTSGSGPSFLLRAGVKLDFLVGGLHLLPRSYTEAGLTLPGRRIDWRISLRGAIGQTRTSYSPREWVAKRALTANLGLVK